MCQLLLETLDKLLGEGGGGGGLVGEGTGQQNSGHFCTDLKHMSRFWEGVGLRRDHVWYMVAVLCSFVSLGSTVQTSLCTIWREWGWLIPPG